MKRGSEFDEKNLNKRPDLGPSSDELIKNDFLDYLDVRSEILQEASGIYQESAIQDYLLEAKNSLIKLRLDSFGHIFP